MTRSQPHKTDAGLRQEFASSAHTPVPNGKKRKKRMAPLSIRLSPDERARLEVLAGKQPIGAFVKSRMFAANDNIPPQPNSRPIVNERVGFAKMLGMLAQMDVFLNTANRILKLLIADIGNLWRIERQGEQMLLAHSRAAHGVAFIKGAHQIIRAEPAHIMHFHPLIVLFEQVERQIFGIAALIADQNHGFYSAFMPRALINRRRISARSRQAAFRADSVSGLNWI